MKNILYIGNYKDNSGLGQSCRRFVDFLGNDIKRNLATRPLYLIKNQIAERKEDDQYLEYENNKLKSYDTLIQHTFPDYIEYHKDFGKNIAIVEIETIGIKHSGWVDKLNLMDEVWVSSIFSMQSLLLSGVTTNIKIIPEPYNLETIQSKKDVFFEYSNDKKPFIFYTSGQYSEKKNIKSILLAYLLEFDKSDNVKLFVKTYDYRKNNDELENIIKYDTSVIKNIIRKNSQNYPDIDILCGYLSNNDMIRLHQSSDCYINAARGDGFGACAIEAALCDSLIINTKNIGSSTYFNNTNALMIDSVEVPVLCSNSYTKNLYTMHERWFEPSINELRRCLRKAFNLSKIQKETYNNNFNKTIFSYNKISELLK
jgi:glycosyltransferase involved in cell wall biosynthesis